jgi:signal peptidase II
MAIKKKLTLFIVCCIFCVAADQTTKIWARQYLKNKPDKSYLADTFRLIYVENTGAALSLGDGLHPTASFWLLSMLPLAFLIFVVYYVLKNINTSPFSRIIFIAMVVAGGIGNIIDRIIFDRHVTDFMNIDFGKIRTGIFNVADVFVTSGVIGLLLFSSFKKDKSVNA